MSNNGDSVTRHVRTSLSWLAQRWGLPGSSLQQWCAVALAATGTFALASLIPFLAAGRPTTAQFPLNVLYAPAWFLFDAFLWFALLIPALCYAYVFVLFSERVTREVPAALVAVALVLPVLSTLAHVVTATDRALAAVALVAAFGRVPAAILLILVLMLEGVAGFALLQRWRRRDQRQPAPAAAGRSGGGFAAHAGRTGRPGPRPLATSGGGDGKRQRRRRGGPRRHRAVPSRCRRRRRRTRTRKPPPVRCRSCSARSRIRLPPSRRTARRPPRPPPRRRSRKLLRPTARRSAARGGRSRPRSYRVPLDILDAYEPEAAWQVDNDTRDAATTLMATLAEFKIDAEVTGIRRGPVITMFELLPAPGVKISRIVNLADNIALRLAASRVRIVAPIPGKHAVGIEVPNRRRAVVSFREIVSLPQFKPDPKGLPTGVPIVLGKDITGEAQVFDLTATPHLLIAGATGAGKSVLVNALICSVLYSRVRRSRCGCC